MLSALQPRAQGQGQGQGAECRWHQPALSGGPRFHTPPRVAGIRWTHGQAKTLCGHATWGRWSSHPQRRRLSRCRFY